jgi:hypothetical protein
MAHKNGKIMTQDEHKMLAKMVLMQADELQRLWDIIYELKLDAISAGRPISDAHEWQAGHVARQQHAAVEKMQREKIWKSLGLD